MGKLLIIQESPMYEALAIHVLAGCLKDAGHQSDLLIESEEKDLHAQIKDIKPSLIALSVMTRQQEWALVMIKRIKAQFNIPILIGGTHITMYPETLEDCEADFACVGEGEGPIVDLLDALDGLRSVHKIPNIHVKNDDGTIEKNPIRPLIQDWDQVPMPDRSVYGRYPFLSELPLKRFYTSVGCAYKCSFCYINNFREAYKGKGKFFRRKSIDRVIQEMKDVQDNSVLKRVHFVDDIFSLDLKWVSEFLPVYWKEIGIPWTANIWIAHMKEPIVKMFKEYGCAGLTFGVESGNEETRRGIIDKNLPDNVYVEHCGYLRKYKIPFHTGNIIGLPGEGLEKAYETAQFNRKIGVTSTRAGLFWPFPGTKLTQYAVEHGMLAADYSVKYFNRGIYPKTKHVDMEKLNIIVGMFQLISKWEWFENMSRFLIRYPNNPAIKLAASVVDKFYLFSEARFFGLLNWAGIKYWWKLRASLINLKRHEEDARYVDEFKSLDELTQGLDEEKAKEIKESYHEPELASARDGIT